MKYTPIKQTDIGPNVSLHLPLSLMKRVGKRLQDQADELGIPVEEIASDAVNRAFHDDALNLEDSVYAATALLDLVVKEQVFPSDDKEATGESVEDLRHGLRCLSRLVRANARFAVQDAYCQREALAALRAKSPVARAA